MDWVKAWLKRMEQRSDLGYWAVGAAFVAMVLAIALDAPTWLRVILQAGFIGGFTDTIALHMIFTRHRFLPGSGVLERRKDAIVVSLAETMEEHILNPSLIEARVRELVAGLDRERLLKGLNAVVDTFRQDLILFISAPEQRAGIARAVRKQGGFWGDMADAVGVVTYENLGDRIVGGLVRQLEEFQVDAPILAAAEQYIGTLDGFLLEPGNPLIRRHYGSEKSVAQILFERLDARRLVIDKLGSYSAAEIRDIVERSIRQHLAWLQAFGVILGMAMAGLILLLEAAVGRG
jgi:uncharacterized membrane-anchored protein YjiN (DUF445 family)